MGSKLVSVSCSKRTTLSAMHGADPDSGNLSESSRSASGSDHMNPRLPAPRLHYPASTGIPFVAQILSSAPSGTQTHAYHAELLPFSDITLSDSRMLADAIRVYSSMEDFAPLPASNKAADPSANIRLCILDRNMGRRNFFFRILILQLAIRSRQISPLGLLLLIFCMETLSCRNFPCRGSITRSRSPRGQQRLAICSSSFFSLGLYKEVVVGFVYSLPVS